MNFTELTLLLSSDEALRCVVLLSFVICFSCYYLIYCIKIKRDRQLRIWTSQTKFMFRQFNGKPVSIASFQCTFLWY